MQSTYLKFLLLLSIVSLFAACTTSKSILENKSTTPKSNTVLDKNIKKPKNIIFLIGDGMGLTQITAGMYMNNNHLNLERCTNTGLHKSYSADNLITDSAAGATAFACGVKTYNAAIGVGPDSTKLETIIEKAEANGLATGLIVTCYLSHATPASFIAHQKDRYMYEEISADFLNTDVDLLIGGGKKFFDKRTIDKRNLYTELQQKGYYVSDYSKESLELMIPPNQNICYFTADDQPKKASEGRDYLPLASAIGANFLKTRSPKGFFLMIEGSQIDWGGHAKDSDYIISEMLDFDNTIGQILDFAEKDGETLVIITADHETGGYSINKGSQMGNLQTAFTSDWHTGTMIPVFAYGPGASLFNGVYENTAIHDKMMLLLGLK